MVNGKNYSQRTKENLMKVRENMFDNLNKE